jgi:hypothetical protein
VEQQPGRVSRGMTPQDQKLLDHALEGSPTESCHPTTGRQHLKSPTFEKDPDNPFDRDFRACTLSKGR